jgi:hypothetical protein
MKDLLASQHWHLASIAGINVVLMDVTRKKFLKPW